MLKYEKKAIVIHITIAIFLKIIRIVLKPITLPANQYPLHSLHYHN